MIYWGWHASYLIICKRSCWMSRLLWILATVPWESHSAFDYVTTNGLNEPAAGRAGTTSGEWNIHTGGLLEEKWVRTWEVQVKRLVIWMGCGVADCHVNLLSVFLWRTHWHVQHHHGWTVIGWQAAQQEAVLNHEVLSCFTKQSVPCFQFLFLCLTEWLQLLVKSYNLIGWRQQQSAAVDSSATANWANSSFRLSCCILISSRWLACSHQVMCQSPGGYKTVAVTR